MKVIAKNILIQSREIRNKYSLYQNTGLITDYNIIGTKNFMNNFIPKLNLIPLTFLNNIIKIIDELKPYQNYENIDELIDDKLDYELKNEKIIINEKHKKRLHRIIYYFNKKYN